jgi:integrase
LSDGAKYGEVQPTQGELTLPTGRCRKKLRRWVRGCGSRLQLNSCHTLNPTRQDPTLSRIGEGRGRFLRRRPDPPSTSSSDRADAAWKAARLKRITPHGCRHSFASIAIAAGVNIGTVSAALGHASVKITWDRYHHLMPGTMEQAAELIQAYMDGGAGA